MSTPAHILLEDNGTYYGVYVNWDGDTHLQEIRTLTEQNFNGSLKDFVFHLFKHPAWSSLLANNELAKKLAGDHIVNDPKIGNFYNDIPDDQELVQFKNLYQVLKYGQEYTYIISSDFKTVTKYDTNKEVESAKF